MVKSTELISFVTQLVVARAGIIRYSILARRIHIVKKNSHMMAPPFDSDTGILRHITGEIICNLYIGNRKHLIFQYIFHIGHLIRTVTDIIFDCQRLSLPETVEKEQNGYK